MEFMDVGVNITLPNVSHNKAHILKTIETQRYVIN